MQLNFEGRKELRKEVEEYLIGVPANYRIKIDSDTLDELLFEKIKFTYHKDGEDRQVFCKIPIWSGSFLRKLDLSEVSFKDVNWNFFLGKHKVSFIDGDNYTMSNRAILRQYFNLFFGVELRDAYIDEDLERKLASFLNSDFYENYLVDYSFTNAKIDFSEAYKNGFRTNVSNCNFRATDLSDNTFSKGRTKFRFVDLSFSDLKIKSIDTRIFYSKNARICFQNCNLRNLELDNINVDFFKNTDWLSCNVAYTGINVIVYPGKLSGVRLKEYQKQLLNFIKNNPGICINGKKLNYMGINMSAQEIEENKEIILNEYKTYKKEKLRKITSLTKVPFEY